MQLKFTHEERQAILSFELRGFGFQWCIHEKDIFCEQPLGFELKENILNTNQVPKLLYALLLVI